MIPYEEISYYDVKAEGKMIYAGLHEYVYSGRHSSSSSEAHYLIQLSKKNPPEASLPGDFSAGLQGFEP